MDRFMHITNATEYIRSNLEEGENSEAVIQARRTAFVARFIILREAKRTRAHRIIEHMQWDKNITAEELAAKFKKAFVDNKDSVRPVHKDIEKALAHADRSIAYFVSEYSKRSTNSFVEALEDYERSTLLLFGEGEVPRAGGWRLPKEIRSGGEK